MQSTRHPRNWKTDRQGMWQPRSNTPVQESRGRISAAEQGSNRGARTRRSKAVPGDSLSTGRIQEDLTERTSALSLDPGHHLDDSNAFTARRMARTATTSNVATTSSDPESLTPPRYSPNPSSRALTVGIGSGLGEIGDYQRHHHRLLEPNDEYEEQFIEQKKREPFGKYSGNVTSLSSLTTSLFAQILSTLTTDHGVVTHETCRPARSPLCNMMICVSAADPSE